MPIEECHNQGDVSSHFHSVSYFVFIMPTEEFHNQVDVSTYFYISDHYE